MSAKVLVAMSGGVDSSVAALLLLREGYETAGATFLLQEDDGDCAAVTDARLVCDRLGIAHHVLDYRARFRREVTDYFAKEYQRGATPNPCVACNRHIKFGTFAQTAREMGFDCIATGHYARTVKTGGGYLLKKGACVEKDQSYVLYTLTQEILARVKFPLGAYSKEQARAIAREADLSVSGKADSQDVCFVPDGNYCAFLERYLGKAPPAGDFIDADGNALGRHRGLWHFTVGQRKGLGVSFGKPVYVAAVNAQRNTVTLADNASLFACRLIAQDLCLINGRSLPFRCEAKIRYGATPAPAEVLPLANDEVCVVFQDPQRAVTPGQAVVFYEGDAVIGGATIINRA